MNRRNLGHITDVFGLACDVGLKPGDFLLSINGNNIRDILDYYFYSAEPNIDAKVLRGGRVLHFSAENPDFTELGCSFSLRLFDGEMRCKNNCIFCFISQLPKGMRSSLYHKDDDYRSSLLSGSYVTLTNLSGGDIERIKALRISPLNVSVHTTDGELRKKLLNNPKASELMPVLTDLKNSGIELNCQIVLIPGINDGAVLEKSIHDLAELDIMSLSVVPVGLTAHRDGLTELSCFDRAGASAVIDLIEGAQLGFLEKYGTRLVYPADEFFIIAGRDIPGYEYYEEFYQIENGVGMVANDLYEFENSKNITGEIQGGHGKLTVSLVTGVSAYLFIKSIAKRLEVWYNIVVNVFCVNNTLFGPDITVSGLIGGRDIAEQLRGKDLGELLVLPENILRRGTEDLIDDYTVSELSEQLSVPVVCTNLAGIGAVIHARGVDRGQTECR